MFQNAKEILKKTARAVHDVLRATNPNAMLCFSRTEGDIRFINCNFDDAYIIGLGTEFCANIHIMPERHREAVQRNADAIEKDLCLALCGNLGINVPRDSSAAARYMLMSYVKAMGQPLEIQMRFRTMADFLKRGCVILLGLKGNSLSAYLVWINGGALSGLEKFHGIQGKSIRFLCLCEVPIHKAASFDFIHYRIISALQDTPPASIEDCVNLLIRREIIRELEEAIPILGTLGRPEASSRWRGDMLSISYSDFGKLPFVPEEAGIFAQWLANVASVIQYGDPSLLQKINLHENAAFSAAAICLENNVQGYQAIMEASKKMPISSLMGIGGLVLSTKIFMPYENPQSLDYNEQNLVDLTHALGSAWRKENLDKTVMRLSIGFLPFYPFPRNNSLTINFMPAAAVIAPDTNFTSFLQFGKSADIVIPDKYARDGSVSDADLFWLDSIQERICNFVYSWLCSKAPEPGGFFTSKLEGLAKGDLKQPLRMRKRIVKKRG